MEFKQKLIIFFSFFGILIFGTLIHEFGHYAMAKFYNCDNIKFSYGSVYSEPQQFQEAKELYQKNKTSIEKEEYFTGRERYDELKAVIKRTRFRVTLGGPLATLFLGFIAFLLSFKRLKNRALQVAVLATLIHLFYFPMIFIRELLKIGKYWSSDIQKLARFHFEVDPIVINTVFSTISIILVLIHFKKIKKYILNDYGWAFATIGGISGVIFWFYLVGPIILP